MTSRKPPSAAFWITVAVIVVLAGYPLSFGPACWISSRMDTGTIAVSIVFRPILWGCPNDFAGRLEDGWICRYAQLAAANGWGWWRWPDDDSRWRWTNKDHGYL